MKYLTLKEMQQVSYELLMEFDRVCKDNDLRYDLCGGTLLGAIRHQGFIPWDDDIDISMPRPDYERLLALYRENQLDLAHGRSVVSCRDNTFPRHYARYVRHDVKRDSFYADDSDCQYIGIDIFPMDGVPSDEGTFGRQVAHIEKLRRLLLLSTSRPGTSSRGHAIALLKNLVRPIAKAFGPFRIARRLERICMRVPFEDAAYVGGITGMYGKRERMLKEVMLPQAEFEFEGHFFPSYKNYDIYLTNLYGSYLTLPPEDQRVPHGDKGYWAETESRVGR